MNSKIFALAIGIISIVCSTQSLQYVEKNFTKQEKDIMCVIVWDPHCGSDGVKSYTFSNLCELNKAQKKNSKLTGKKGECPRKEKFISCSDQVDRNKCELDEAHGPNSRLQAEIQVDKQKRPNKVEKDVVCILIWDPYCASNGVTYPNSCELAKAEKKYPNLTAEKGKCSK